MISAKQHSTSTAVNAPICNLCQLRIVGDMLVLQTNCDGSCCICDVSYDNVMRNTSVNTFRTNVSGIN